MFEKFGKGFRIEFHSPTIKIFWLLVVIVENCAEESLVVGVAIRTVDRFEIVVMHRLPTTFKHFGPSATTFWKPCIANFAVVSKKQSTCSLHSSLYVWIVGSRKTLIALAMVVGTDIKKSVSLAVVPSADLIVGNNWLTLRSFTRDLSHQPTARNNGVGFEQLNRTIATHLWRNYRSDILFKWYMIN